MDIDPNQLPNDPAALRQMVVGLLEEAAEQERRLQQLQHWLEQLLRARYGPRRERVNENQLFLFAVALVSAGQEPRPDPESPTGGQAEEARRAKPKGHGRQPLPKSLQRQRVVHDLAEEERQCPQCQEELKRIGEEVSERLEYVPASLVVIQEACQKYACPKGCTVVTAGKPMAPIEKGLPGPGLLAQVAVSKYGDHLPLHRQEEIFQRQGVELSRQTMCDWMRACADLVSPLYELMKQRVLGSKAVQTDDTPVPVLDPELPRTRTGRIWTYVGDDEHPYTVYDYTPNRSRDGPEEFLKEFRGYLQADAYSGYDHFYEGARARHCRGRLLGARQAEVFRSAVFGLDALDGDARLYPLALRRGARSPRPEARRRGTPGAATGEIETDSGRHPRLSGARAAARAAQESRGGGHRLHVVELEGADPLLRGRRSGDRQQRRRAQSARRGGRTEELDVLRQRQRRADGRRADQPDRHLQKA